MKFKLFLFTLLISMISFAGIRSGTADPEVSSTSETIDNPDFQVLSESFQDVSNELISQRIENIQLITADYQISGYQFNLILDENNMSEDLLDLEFERIKSNQNYTKFVTEEHLQHLYRTPRDGIRWHFKSLK